MPRFICTHNRAALEKLVLPSGKVLAFDYRGVLDTDGEGAAVIRGHPLYNRLILEDNESASSHPETPAPKLPAQVPVPTREPETPEQREQQRREQFARRMATVTEHAKAVRAQMEAEGFGRREVPFAERWLLDEFRRAGGSQPPWTGTGT